MVNAGRILIITKGTWDSLVSYEQLDLVTYNQIAYIARQASVGVNPANDTAMTYWQPFGSAASIATTAAPGLVMPDGDTIKIDNTGLIWVELDASDVDYDGSVSGLSATDVKTAIDQAVALARAAMTGIAPIEATSTASQAYSQGDLFFYNGKLYVATASIAQGGTITPNTNCSQTSIEALIAGKADKPTILTSTLTAGATTLTFTNAAIGNNSRISLKSDPFVKGLLEDIVQNGTTVTATFNAQQSNVSVMLIVEN